jgi:hypothetical protein
MTHLLTFVVLFVTATVSCLVNVRCEVARVDVAAVVQVSAGYQLVDRVA